MAGGEIPPPPLCVVKMSRYAILSIRKCTPRDIVYSFRLSRPNDARDTLHLVRQVPADHRHATIQLSRAKASRYTILGRQFHSHFTGARRSFAQQSTLACYVTNRIFNTSRRDRSIAFSSLLLLHYAHAVSWSVTGGGGRRRKEMRRQLSVMEAGRNERKNGLKPTECSSR